MSEVPSLTPAGILFLHPGYNSPNNRLFRLPCNDNDSTRQISGVHHQTALLACQIIANNAFTGFLALDADGGRRADATVELHDILGGRQYYFIVPGNTRYPIVPSFRDWEFPHNRFPDFWPRLPPTEGQRSNFCVVSKKSWALMRAHIIPAIETAWFKKNDMSRYSNSRYADIDDSKNLFLLRADVHVCLDAHMFTLIPKLRVSKATANTEPTKTHTYTLHVLADSCIQFTETFHNEPLPDLQGVAAEYLFARFAMAIFISIKPFICAGFKRSIARFMVKDETKGAENICEDVGGESLENQYGGGKSRNASPTKRTKTSGGIEEQEEMRAAETDYTLSWDKHIDDTRSVAILDQEQNVNDAAEFHEDAAYLWHTDVLPYYQDRGRGRKRQRTFDQVDGCYDSLVAEDDTVLEEGKGDADDDLPSLDKSASSFDSNL